MGSYQGKPIATWNDARNVWETPQGTLFCEHLVPYSETWPRSGSMRNGAAFSRPRSEPPTGESGSSSWHGLLPTPTAQLNAPAPWKPGVDWWLQSRATRNLAGVVTGNTPLLPTPVARDGTGLPGKNFQMASLPRQISLLPTPNTLDSMPPKTREQIQAHRDEGKGGDRNLREAVLYELEGQWGRYADAILRWEQVMGRPAPFPTENTGKDGRARLSPRLPEWMMGLPDGWVTDVPGLSYQQQLRLIGNGVVVHQARLALEKLLTVYGKIFSV